MGIFPLYLVYCLNRQDIILFLYGLFIIRHWKKPDTGYMYKKKFNRSARDKGETHNMFLTISVLSQWKISEQVH